MQAWEEFLNELEKSFGKDTVDKWLRSLKIQRFDACNLYLEPTDSFQAMWIEEHIRPIAKQKFRNKNGHQIHLHLQVLEIKKGEPEIFEPPTTATLRFESDATYPHCTFDQYACTKTNEMTYRILCNLVGYDPIKNSITTLPASSPNPIYIHGPNGTGKTHLLMAATHHLTLRGLKVFFVKAESFAQHVVNAIRSSKMQNFRQIYRSTDVLIIDDIDVLGRKTATQEEFFHTFNTLHTAGKQIILSSRCPPRLLEYVEERLISRFEWGICLSLEKSFEPQLLSQILEKRSHLFGSLMNQPLAGFLLKNFPNPAALSRALEYLQSHIQTPLQVMELAHVETILKRLAEQEQKLLLNPDRILDAVAIAFGIKREDILSKSQTREAVLPRKIAMYLLRKELKLPYMKIGDLFGRDHSTVMSSIKQIQEDLENNHPDIAYYFNQLRSSLTT